MRCARNTRRCVTISYSPLSARRAGARGLARTSKRWPRYRRWMERQRLGLQLASSGGALVVPVPGEGANRTASEGGGDEDTSDVTATGSKTASGASPSSRRWPTRPGISAPDSASFPTQGARVVDMLHVTEALTAERAGRDRAQDGHVQDPHGRAVERQGERRSSVRYPLLRTRARSRRSSSSGGTARDSPRIRRRKCDSRRRVLPVLVVRRITTRARPNTKLPAEVTRRRPRMAFFNPSTTRSVGRRAAGHFRVRSAVDVTPPKVARLWLSVHPDGSAPRPGQSPGSSDAEVKAAYRKAALRWHPDRHARFGPRDRGGVPPAVPSRERGVARLSGGGDARGGRGSARARPGGVPWSSHAAGSGAGSGYGYYNGSDGPSGSAPRSPRARATTCVAYTRNIRVLYAGLACLGALIYPRPGTSEPGGAGQGSPTTRDARPRSRRTTRAALRRAREPDPRPRARPSTRQTPENPRFRGAAISQARTTRLGTGTRSGTKYDYAYEGGGDAGDVPRTPGTVPNTSGTTVVADRPRGLDFMFDLWRGGTENVARAAQRVVAEGGGATWRAEREREAASGDLGEAVREFGGGSAAPEWAAGGYAGRGNQQARVAVSRTG